MARFWKFLRVEKGQALMLVAISMVVLIGFTAFATDVGYLHLQKRNLQNAADAAALAAAWELPGDVSNKAKEYAEKNNVDGEVVATKQNNDTEVKVVITEQFPRFLGRLFGNTEYNVVSEATAKRRVEWGGYGHIQPFAPLPKNYTDLHTCPNGLSVEPLLYDNEGLDRTPEEIFTLLSSRPISNLSFYSGSMEARLEDFKEKVDIGASIGVIADRKKSGSNWGFIDLTGGNGAAGASVIAGWIYYGTEPFDEETVIKYNSNPGNMNSIFTGFNWENGQSPVPYLISESGGTYYILLPHPSIDVTAPHTDIIWGDFLIARVFSDPAKYGCSPPQPHYRLIGVIEEVYNPLNASDVEKLVLAGVKSKKDNPFLIN